MKTKFYLALVLFAAGIIYSTNNILAQNTKNINAIYANTENIDLKNDLIHTLPVWKEKSAIASQHNVLVSAALFGLRELEKEIKFHPVPDNEIETTGITENTMDNILQELYPVVKYKPMAYLD